jgi:hypothetical protein
LLGIIAIVVLTVPFGKYVRTYNGMSNLKVINNATAKTPANKHKQQESVVVELWELGSNFGLDICITAEEFCSPYSIT